MTSETGYKEAFVWVWLPGDTHPVVAGRLELIDKQIVFNYGRSYLARNDAISLYDPELPLGPGIIAPVKDLWMAGCIRDAAPDAWGRRVIINRKFGVLDKEIDVEQLDELTYLLESGSDRVGALDFQQSATKFVARQAAAPSLEELLNAVESIENGVPLTPELEAALLHGSSIGGARPKVLIESDKKKYVAKFSSKSDIYSVVKAEYVAMRLAAEVGINAVPVTLKSVAGKDVLLIERFDRTKSKNGWHRRAMVSALTLLELDDLMARYASYEELATIIRHRFTNPKETLRELFARMLFNVVCGNTDDHARNHAAFWDGYQLTLTPAYDICPQERSGGEASQAMFICGKERLSQIVTCLKAAPSFLLTADESLELAKGQIKVVQERWLPICTEAKLSEVDRNLLWRRAFLNPFAFVDAPAELTKLIG
jgi:serine/threonine-protein kinase HipA